MEYKKCLHGDLSLLEIHSTFYIFPFQIILLGLVVINELSTEIKYAHSHTCLCFLVQ